MADTFLDPEILRNIHANLHVKEVEQHKYLGLSPHLRKRIDLVDWIHLVAEKFRLRYTSSASAVAYLNAVMDFYRQITFEELQILAMGCLMVGAKMEEQEPNIPLVTQLIKVAKINCTVQQMSEAELMVLKAHAWNVCIVTPNHFIEMYSRESAKDDLVSCRQQAIEHIDRIAEFATEAARLASRDDNLLQFRPSVLATAAVVCGRKMLDVEPHFSKALSDLSGCTTPSKDVSSDLGVCCEKLIRLCCRMNSSSPTSPVTAHAAAMDISSPLAGTKPAAAATDAGPVRHPLADISTMENTMPAQATPAGGAAGGLLPHSQPAEKWQNGDVMSYELDQQIFGEYI